MGTKGSQPPGPGGLGLTFIPRLQSDLLGHVTDLHAKYGDCVRYRVGPVLVYQFTHPEQAHEILAIKNRSFHKPARLHQVLGRWTGNGLVLNEGDSWVRQRRLVKPAFAQERLRSYGSLAVKRAEEMIAGWADSAALDVAPELSRLTLRVISEALFDEDVADKAEEFYAHIAALQVAALEEMAAPFLWPDWWPLQRKRTIRAVVDFLDSVVLGIIAKRRREGGDRGDLLSMLLLAVDEEGDKTGMTDRQARDESVNLMLGGNETTATALTWALYCLARHPEAQEWVLEEINALPKDALLSLEVLPRTVMVFKEVMRLYPPAYFIAREAVEEVEIGGYALPRGSNVHLVPYLTHRDARWFPEPEAFLRDRFAPEREAQLLRAAYLPFGAGPRACIGRGLAMVEGALVLATILKRFRLRLLEGAPEPVIEAQVSLHPRGGLRLLVERRLA
jgi:cytochrome P450